MNRKLKYIVLHYSNEMLFGCNTWQRIVELKDNNIFHYVSCPTGELVQLKSTEENNPDDEKMDTQCLHVLLHKTAAVDRLAGLLLGLVNIAQNDKALRELKSLYPGVQHTDYKELLVGYELFEFFKNMNKSQKGIQ